MNHPKNGKKEACRKPRKLTTQNHNSELREKLVKLNFIQKSFSQKGLEK